MRILTWVKVPDHFRPQVCLFCRRYGAGILPFGLDVLGELILDDIVVDLGDGGDFNRGLCLEYQAPIVFPSISVSTLSLLQLMTPKLIW